MLEHRRRRVTRYEPATPSHPWGYGGVGPSASLSLLPDASRHRIVTPPCMYPHGASNEAGRGPAAPC